MVTDKPSRISTILRPLYRKPEALSLLFWGVPILIAAFSLYFGYRNSVLGNIKLSWLITEFVFLPIFVLTFLGAYYRRREAVAPTPFFASRTRRWLPFISFVVILFPLAFALDRGIFQGDENAYLFQARCLNAGALYMDPPPQIPLTAITYDHHVIFNGKWFGKYPPGWPLVLSIGTATQWSWLINPLLSLGLLWLTYRIGVKTFGERAGIGSVWLMALSAYFSINCLGFMSHPLSGLLVAAAVFCSLKISKSESRGRRWLWMAGAFVCLTAVSAVRPFTAACAGVAILAAWTIHRNWSAVGRFLLYSALWGVVVIASMAIQNHSVTGSYRKNSYDLTNTHTDAISVNPGDLGLALRYNTPRRILDTVSTTVPYLFALAVYGFWRRRKERFAWMLALLFVVMVVGHTVELIDSGSPFGERYYFEAFFGMALLAAEGWLQLVKDVQPSALVRRNAIASAVVASCVMIALSAYSEIGLRWPSRQMAKAADHPPAHTDLVFVERRGSIEPERLNFNKPDGKILFLNDPGPSQRAELAQRAGRPNWVCLYYDPAKKAAAWSK